jgi:hypothetical protein
VPSKTLDVPYHQQDEGNYCGAASAQMVLRTPGTPLEKQHPLFTEGHNAGHLDPLIGWAIAPDGLAFMLNDQRPANFPGTFALSALDTCDAISRKIVWAIFAHGFAPVALVYGYGHWIAVHGYDISANPTGPTDSSYTIAAFDVRDPWPPASDMKHSPVPPHKATDRCGSGGDRGVAPQHVAYGEWQQSLMTGVPSGTPNSYWHGKFVAACDPDEPPLSTGPIAKPLRRRRARSGRLAGSEMLPPAEAGRAAIDGLNAYGVAQRPGWQTPLNRIRPGKAQLVQRLDRVDSFYYLVPILMGGDRASAMTLVDALSGAYLQAAALGIPGTMRILDAATALTLCVNRRFMLSNNRGSLLVRPEAASVHPVMVWRPCAESKSPYQPFYVVTIGGDRLYVRSDGAVFTALHDAVPGS